MGPKTSYKLGEITLFIGVLTLVKPIYFRPFMGVITLLITSRGLPSKVCHWQIYFFGLT